MKLKFMCSVIQGIRVLETQVNDFCKENDVSNITTAISGAQVVATITYYEKNEKNMKPSTEHSTETPKPTKKKVSKARAK